jgi:tetraacyldisaccharide 4'-kinase
MLAMQQLAPDIFLLDDGFQHLRLNRDLDILLQDFSRPFGNGLTLPAGILREPAAAAKRADMILFTRAPEAATVPTGTGKIPAATSCHTLADLLPLHGTAAVPFSNCLGKKAVAFAGIADPESFFAGVRAKGVNLTGTISFPDHVVYNNERYKEIAEAMRTSGAELLITTEKDGVKLKRLPKEYAGQTMLARLELTINNPELLQKILTKLLNSHEA